MVGWVNGSIQFSFVSNITLGNAKNVAKIVSSCPRTLRIDTLAARNDKTCRNSVGIHARGKKKEINVATKEGKWVKEITLTPKIQQCQQVQAYLWAAMSVD